LLDRPLQTKPKTGKPRVLDQNQVRRINEFVTNIPVTNSVQIREALNLNCGLSTIRLRLHELGVHARTPAKKIQLTPAQAEARLQFCMDNLYRDWSNVIFTDEKVFMSSQDTPIRLIWRRDGTRCW
jgi:hypothetical protein